MGEMSRFVLNFKISFFNLDGGGSAHNFHFKKVSRLTQRLDKNGYITTKYISQELLLKPNNNNHIRK